MKHGSELMNLYAGWSGLFLGCIAGALLGLCFHRDDWLGGYTSWRRRMFRLAHISFFGIAVINLAYAAVASSGAANSAASSLLVVAAVTMPLFCYLSGLRPALRHALVVPAICVIAGTGIVAWRLMAL